MDGRRRLEKERKIVECVKESILYDSYTPKKAITYQLADERR